MVTGAPYREVHDYLAPRLGYYVYDDDQGEKLDKARWVVGVDFDKQGMGVMDDALRYLWCHGYATQMRWQSYVEGTVGCERIEDYGLKWPPDPWAPIHLCTVTTSQSHAVVMCEDGEVLDPYFSEKNSLGDYSYVSNVVGVWKVK